MNSIKLLKINKNVLFQFVLKLFLFRAVIRLAELFEEADKTQKICGIAYATRQVLFRLNIETDVKGVENIPTSGPLIIASNHPGTFDAIILASQLPRNDLMIIVSDNSFFRDLPNLKAHFIFSTIDPMDRMEVIRKSIRHLKTGGALLFFPSGKIDPDPAVLPGASQGISDWSRSLEIFLKKVQDSRLILAITSGVISNDFINHFITQLYRSGHERRRVMEFMQVIKVLVNEKQFQLNPKITFSEEITNEQLQLLSSNNEENLIRALALNLLDIHLKQIYAGIC